jgi:anti-sigma factor RsiW
VSHDDNHVDCRRLVDLLGDYVDDQLDADQKQAVDAHVAQCAPCVAFLRQYRFAPTAVREHLLRSVPVDLENRLLSFLRDRVKR